MINFENVIEEFNGPESDELKLCEKGSENNIRSNDRRNMIAFEDQE
jgi:hypothetical protein